MPDSVSPVCTTYRAVLAVALAAAMDGVSALSVLVRIILSVLFALRVFACAGRAPSSGSAPDAAGRRRGHEPVGKERT
jgi:hypothetical protein